MRSPRGSKRRAIRFSIYLGRVLITSSSAYFGKRLLSKHANKGFTWFFATKKCAVEVGDLLNYHAFQGACSMTGLPYDKPDLRPVYRTHGW